MIIHNINFGIGFDAINLNQEEYLEKLNFFMEEMKKKHPDGLSFEELLKIIPLNKFRYHITSIDFPDLEHDDPDKVIRKETKIEIRA